MSGSEQREVPHFPAGNRASHAAKMFLNLKSKSAEKRQDENPVLKLVCWESVSKKASQAFLEVT